MAPHLLWPGARPDILQNLVANTRLPLSATAVTAPVFIWCYDDMVLAKPTGCFQPASCLTSGGWRPAAKEDQRPSRAVFYG